MRRRGEDEQRRRPEGADQPGRHDRTGYGDIKKKKISAALSSTRKSSGANSLA